LSVLAGVSAKASGALSAAAIIAAIINRVRIILLLEFNQTTYST
jgi:hypothetical protein